MKTTLAIDDDVLDAAREIAERQEKNLGEVISDLARRSLEMQQLAPRRNGVPLIKRKPTGRTITPEIVNKLRDEYP
ncbi:CopG family transcriptional regulator [Rhizobium leguminosarum]|uniref:CopG family transcriptional regulator n=1 Tax=Rhizobium leguminosarum TaxID=384 RepID=UPI001C950677|nr:CopG family transcriptional regulator [Rhizobium leguminosarum]MBY5790487.1 CopG family transcriptional regulator [Rhizobium leguminosarum]